MAVVAVPLIMLSGCNMGQYEEPVFTASQAEDGMEIREYKPVLAAEVEVYGERREAISQGFRILADYIFGNNELDTKISMTTPVIQQANGAGTPVLMEHATTKPTEMSAWKVQFVMPAEYTLETIPMPRNPSVKLRTVGRRTMAVIRFSGSTTNDSKIAKKIAELEVYVKAHSLQSTGAPVLAFYDPPWTLPFLRRNEIMLEVQPFAKKQ